MASPVRKLEIGLVICGILAGFGVTLAGLTFFRGKAVPAPTARPLAPAVIPSPPGGISSPAALDTEWAAYSRRSGCADWAGGDGVSAIRLNPSQLAWFFSDSYLGPAGPATGFSHASGFVHNSVVIQTAAGRGSRFVTLTGGHTCSAPGGESSRADSVVAAPRRHGRPRVRYWSGDGMRAGPYVVKFYNAYLPGPPPFTPVGTVVARFRVSKLADAGRGGSYGGVARPLVTALPPYTPSIGGTPIVWGSAMLPVGGLVYVYGWQSAYPAADRQLYVARVAVSRVADFAAWRFYAGPGQWAPGQASAVPVQPSGPGVAAGFSVVALAGRYWLIQQGVTAGNPDIDAYPAPAPWGPFDPAAAILLYRSPDIGLNAAHDYRIMYEARAEPALSGPGALVLSYNVNSAAVTVGCVPMSGFTNTITLPRFVAVPRAVFSDPALAGRYRVVAGPSRYPSIVAKDPSQWFNGWAYRGGCPPVPAVLGVAARQSGNAVGLEWPSAGLGLRYRVYVRAPGGAYALACTVGSPSATLSGLRRGLTYQIRVVAVNIRQQAGGGAVTSVPVG